MTWLSKIRRLAAIWWTLFRELRTLRRYESRSGDITPPARFVETLICSRCPVAEFFKQQNATELRVQIWCALDYPLAVKWGGHLERKGSVALGKDHWDFRWNIDPARQSKQTKIEADA